MQRSVAFLSCGTFLKCVISCANPENRQCGSSLLFLSVYVNEGFGSFSAFACSLSDTHDSVALIWIEVSWYVLKRSPFHSSLFIVQVGRYFKVEQRNSSLWQEIRAGTVTFLTVINS